MSECRAVGGPDGRPVGLLLPFLWIRFHLRRVRVIAFAVARPRYATIPSSHSNIRPKAVSHDTIRYDAAAALLVYRDVTKRGLRSAAVVVWEEIELLRCRPPTKKKGNK